MGRPRAKSSPKTRKNTCALLYLHKDTRGTLKMCWQQTALPGRQAPDKIKRLKNKKKAHGWTDMDGQLRRTIQQCRSVGTRRVPAIHRLCVSRDASTVAQPPARGRPRCADTASPATAGQVHSGGRSLSMCSTQQRPQRKTSWGKRHSSHRHRQKKKRPKMDHWRLGGGAPQPLISLEAATATSATSAVDDAKTTTRATALEALTTQCCCSPGGVGRFEG